MEWYNSVVKTTVKKLEYLFPLPVIISFVNAGFNIITNYNITMLGKFSCKVFVKVSDKW